MDKSDFKFLIEQASLLEGVERRSPYLFNKIKKYIFKITSLKVKF